jgi:hypothetical protein
MTIGHIEQAERYVAEGERHIARQRKIVAGLKGQGRRWTALRTAQVLLQTLELAQQFHIAALGPAAHQARRRRMKRAPKPHPRSLSPLAQSCTTPMPIDQSADYKR